MDLREFSPNKAQIDHARKLSIEGLLTYQPFLFSDDFEVGVGLEFERQAHVGLVYNPGIDLAMLKASPELARLIVDAAEARPFRAANSELRRLYDFLADTLENAVGGARGASFLDVGCNAGYFPLTFAKRGAARALGCDRQDFSRTFALLNEIIGGRAEFLPRYYHPERQRIDDVEPCDAVLSMMMLCHISTPLPYLAALGSLARKALIVLTIINEDEHLSISFGEPRGDYPGDTFPYCFDNLVCPSRALLKRSFELMGFKLVQELDLSRFKPSMLVWKGYRFHALLGVR